MRPKRPTRRSRFRSGSSTREPDDECTVRTRIGLVPVVSAQRADERGRHRRRAADAGRARGAARIRRRDDQRAPRRLPRLPSEPAASGRMVPRSDERRMGRAVPIAATVATARAGRRGDRVDGGAVSRARRPRGCVRRVARRLRHHARADGRPRGRASPRALEELAGILDGSAPGRLAGDAAVAACAATPGAAAERGDGVHRGAPGRPPRRRPAVRLAVGARALPRADRRLPRSPGATAPAC